MNVNGSVVVVAAAAATAATIAAAAAAAKNVRPYLHDYSRAGNMKYWTGFRMGCNF